MVMTQAITERQGRGWVDGYVNASTTGDPADIVVLFAEAAESYEWPYETA